MANCQIFGPSTSTIVDRFKLDGQPFATYDEARRAISRVPQCLQFYYSIVPMGARRPCGDL